MPVLAPLPFVALRVAAAFMIVEPAAARTTPVSSAAPAPAPSPALGAAAANGAQPGAATPAPAQKPCSAPAFHQWDFWLGSWDVTDAKGVSQGSNEITPAYGGCGMVEHWTGAGGGVGTSLNVYDPVRATWTQLWTSPGVIIRLEGKLDGHGAISTEGTITYGRNRIVHAFRGVWTPRPDGSVLQEFLEQDPAKPGWTVWFSGIYRRRTAS